MWIIFEIIVQLQPLLLILETRRYFMPEPAKAGTMVMPFEVPVFGKVKMAEVPGPIFLTPKVILNFIIYRK